MTKVNDLAFGESYVKQITLEVVTMLSLRLCSIGINRFWLVELVGYFRVLLGKTVLVGLVDQLFQPAVSSAETVENDG